MEYEIAEAETPELLIERVREFLDDGWVVTGGVFALTSPPTQVVEPELRYYQAMIRNQVAVEL